MRILLFRDSANAQRVRAKVGRVLLPLVQHQGRCSPHADVLWLPAQGLPGLLFFHGLRCIDRSTCASSWDFDLGGVLPSSHRDIVEDEESLLAVSADEPTSIGPLELGGERIFRLLATVEACQHMAYVLPVISMQEKNRCPFSETSG